MNNLDQRTRPESSTLPDFAKRHSLSISTVYRLIRDGELVMTKIRGLARILDEDESHWLNAVKAANERSGAGSRVKVGEAS